MTNDDTKCRKMEEELNSFWPQWHVDKYLGGDIFGDVFRIYRNDSGLKKVSALRAIQINDYSMAGMEQMQPYSRFSRTDESGGRTEIPEILAEEIQTMELLRGAPNVVEVQDCYYKKNPGTSFLFLRTEYLTSLQDILEEKQQENGSMSADRLKTLHSALKIGLDICSALIYCEQKGIIHRNINPANLFMDSSGNYRLGDFVTPKRLKSVQLDLSMTRTGIISHVAPEIFTWSSCNNTVDIYALGLVLYQLLNGGRMPFLLPEGGYTESDIDSANFQRLHEVPLPPLAEQIVREAAKNGTEISRTNAERLDKIIRKACEADPSKRFQSAGEFYEALNGYSHWPGVKDLKDVSEKQHEQQTKTSPSLQNPQKDERRMRREEIIERWKETKKTEGKTEEKVIENAEEKTVEKTIGKAAERAAEKTAEKTIGKAAGKPGTAKKKQKNNGAKWLVLLLIVGFFIISQKEERNSSYTSWEDRVISEEYPASDEPEMVFEDEEESISDYLDYIPVEITDSWEEIIAAGRDGTYADKYRIGDTKELDLGSEGIITMRLVAMDADELADGSGRAPMTWIAAELLNTEHYMNPEDTNAGGWEDSDMRSWLRESVFPLLPSEVQEGIREVTKYSYSFDDNFYDGSEDVATKDVIWIPSVREIFYYDVYYYDNDDEIDERYEKRGVDYGEVFSDSASREMRHIDASDGEYWWLRSNYDYTIEDFLLVSSDGEIFFEGFASFKAGVVIGFCI